MKPRPLTIMYALKDAGYIIDLAKFDYSTYHPSLIYANKERNDITLGVKCVDNTCIISARTHKRVVFVYLYHLNTKNDLDKFIRFLWSMDKEVLGIGRRL